MALLKRELCRQVKGPEVTHADRSTLVFDTDAKQLYVEREVAHLDVRIDGSLEIQTATMDIGDYLKQGGQTAGHRELWRLLRTIFKVDSDPDEVMQQVKSPETLSRCPHYRHQAMAAARLPQNPHLRRQPDYKLGHKEKLIPSISACR